MKFATLASASFLSKEDRRAYLKAAERDERQAAEREARRAALARRPYSERPCAAAGLTSYRYAGPYGFVMIGARDKADALREAARSLEGAHDPARLEIWSANALRYVKA